MLEYTPVHNLFTNRHAVGQKLTVLASFYFQEFPESNNPYLKIQVAVSYSFYVCCLCLFSSPTKIPFRTVFRLFPPKKSFFLTSNLQITRNIFEVVISRFCATRYYLFLFSKSVSRFNNFCFCEDF